MKEEGEEGGEETTLLTHRCRTQRLIFLKATIMAILSGYCPYLLIYLPTIPFCAELTFSSLSPSIEY